MGYGFLDIAITPSVLKVQESLGSDQMYSNFQGDRRFDRFTEKEADFIAARDSFYLATVSETGWPYVQHRGGASGFLKVIDERTLAFADFRGNRQYLSVGNVMHNNRVCLFLIDYARRNRLKIYAHCEILSVTSDKELTEKVSDPDYRARIEHIFRLRLEAFDWNCSQHINPRFTEYEINQAIAPLLQRIHNLELELEDSRSRNN